MTDEALLATARRWATQNNLPNKQLTAADVMRLLGGRTRRPELPSRRVTSAPKKVDLGSLSDAQLRKVFSRDGLDETRKNAPAGKRKPKRASAPTRNNASSDEIAAPAADWLGADVRVSWAQPLRGVVSRVELLAVGRTVQTRFVKVDARTHRLKREPTAATHARLTITQRGGAPTSVAVRIAGARQRSSGRSTE